eukprot:1518383-Rhodomonas_salina.1
MVLPEFEKDENGRLVLDDDENPIPIEVDGGWAPARHADLAGNAGLTLGSQGPIARFELPEFQRDEEGGLIADEHGNPVPIEVAGGWQPAHHTDVAGGKELVMEGLCCKAHCPHGDTDPSKLESPCCLLHNCLWHQREMGAPIEVGSGWHSVHHPDLAGNVGISSSNAAPMRWMQYSGNAGPE